MPETTRILHTLAAPSIAIASGTSSIMEEEFIQTYKRTKESTSSSPSRRHMGHYKAVIKDPTLVRLHCAMMPMPFQQGFNAERWTKVTDIMLEKEEGNSRCHCLRIIALFESDLNQAKRILIGRRLTHHLADTNMIPDMQFGSVPGKQCHSAVRKKVLSHDHVRLTKTTASFIENDAVGCYDRLVNNLVLMLLVKLGLPTSVASCLGTLWDEVVHHVKTIYGTSTATYGSTSEQPLYGPGQGSTCGPVFWLLCYWVIVESLDPTITAATFYSACNTIITNITGVSFVDDTSLAATSEYQYDPALLSDQNQQEETRHMVHKLGRLGQHWERLLFTTGGAINLQKSHWYLMTWLWKKWHPSPGIYTTSAR